MTNNTLKNEEQLTNLILAMSEGESLENLQDIIKLIKYHSGHQAGVFDGSHSFETIISSDLENLT